jgi:hypothetical protein
MLPPESGALDACLESGFLLAAGQTLTFRHELARLAIEESLLPGRAETLHRKALVALRQHEAAEAPLARLVWACGACAKPRGIADTDLVEGVKIVTAARAAVVL